METIRPISDLKDNFSTISKIVHDKKGPVILTKDGYADMVVMSIEAFEDMQFENEIYFKLQEADKEIELKKVKFSSKEVLQEMKEALGDNV